jgi:RNA polymerase sigma factor (sigma-70 family)
MADDPVTQWIQDLARGDPLVAQRIWEQYFERLVAFARKRLGGELRRAADEQDVALSALASFFHGVAVGRFPALHDHDDLRRLLLTITARKAGKLRRTQHSQKRGSGDVRGESALGRGPDIEQTAGIAAALGREPTPALAAIFAEQCERLLDKLEDPALREIALCKLEGYSNEEIARNLDCVPRTIDRKLARIRQKWSREAL